MLNDKKSSVLYILEILQKYTDKYHSLNYSQIREKLSRLYDITLERKTIARDIDILIEKGYDIIKRGNYGVYLGCREFEEGELLFLTDAIYSSRSMPTKYAKDLVEKLTRDYSIYEKKKYKYLEKIDDGSRVNNKQLFYTIEILNEAIEQGKKVEFQYNSYGLDKKLIPKKDGKKYIINPYYMVNNHGKYYLICNYDKYDNLANYKIECISNIKIIDESIRPLKSLLGQENFSIKNYMQEHIYMVGGKTVYAKIMIYSEERINDIISWFGEKISLFKNEKGIFAEFSVNEESLIYWALQYGEHVEIVEPKETRKKMIETLNKIIKKYNKN
ncbi:MAG: WYL domain-containing protein [Clostridia bacterium]|nr:WYL domain-containing protein [Clostridia bacterium]